MRDDRNNAAIQLRLKGYSIKSIAKEIGAAQSSVSIWTRNVPLTKAQIQQLRKNMHTPDAIERRRQSRLKNEASKRAKIVAEAKAQIKDISQNELWFIGVALYWAEGSKNSGAVQFTNGDPKMINLFMRFLRDICKVSELKIRAHIHIHDHLDTHAAENYWRSVTMIQKEKFYKTYNKPNKSSKGTRSSLPYGVCTIYVLDMKLLLKLKGWSQGIYESAYKVLE